MRFSTKGRYGLRAMIDLAVYAKAGQVALNSIADRQGISLNYLEQVFSALRKAGLVRSIKGAQGGYMLAKNPEYTTTGEIIRVLEGSLSVIDEDETDFSRDNVIRNCIRTRVWDRMDEAVNSYVDSVTLDELARQYQKNNGLDDFMYYI
ncbi:MAG: RrF2 family transcriptional regulator [Thermoclostridium sp.]|nr:RrF2 family transcriptional regulator [Thermoclostridium sp.]